MRRWLILLLACAALLAARGEACAEAAEAPELAPGAEATLTLSATPREYRYTPPSGSVYDVCVFPADEDDDWAKAQLWRGDALLAEGEGRLTVLSLRLTAGAEVRLRLSGEGRVRVEVARHALSRCFDIPMTLDGEGDSYSKAIARSGDVHWYAVTASGEQPVLLAGAADGAAGPALEARLYDARGRMLAEATRTAGGAFLLEFVPEPGETCRVRVSSPDGGTGPYSLRLLRSAGGLPEALTLSRTDAALEGRESFRLTASVSPEGAANLLYWESSDPRVARVSADGVLTGVRAGTAVVTAYAAGGLRAHCRVEVRRVAVERVRLLTGHIALNVGDDAALEWQLLPENASNPRVLFDAEPETVVQVDRSGVLRAVGEGEAVVTVRTADGGFTASARVSVGPAVRRCRALLVGEQRYAATVAAERQGSANSVAGLRSMLGELSFGGLRYTVHTRLDVSRDGALRAIRECFAGTTDQDVSLFYITCHGYYDGGMTYFQMYDGSVLSAAELRLALNEVPGQIVLLVDCCGSGGVIGRAGGTGDILKGIARVFGGGTGASLFADSRFRVLASAAVEQDSYRISFNADAAESDMATVFARALCEGGGWSIERGARGAMRADVNYDGVVTLNELYHYTARRVMWYLTLNGGGDYVQTVQVSPEGDVTSIFERTQAP